MVDINKVWDAALVELKASISQATFQTWFSDAYIEDYDNKQLTIAVRTIFHKARFDHDFRRPLQEIISRLSDSEVESVVATVDSKPAPEKAAAEGGLFAAAAKPTIKAPQANPTIKPKYTFETFIIGNHNQLANAASKAAADNPGETYNPLFIYGGPGLGKTHLMQAIGNAVWKRRPGTSVLYVSCEQFTNDFIQSVSSGRMKYFKDNYRTVDILLIDDIQFLTKKQGTQEEFFHTFNTLHQANKQIVLTSDRPPKALNGLEDRLVSRFEWGIVADIQPPDYETRMAILLSKCREKNISVNPDILEFLARRIEENVRELEGALNKVIGLTLLQPNITITQVEQAMREMAPIFKRQAPPIQHIFTAVARFYNIDVNDLLGSRRQRELVRPRQVGMYLAKQLTSLSYPAIGKEMRGKDHTTVIHGVRKIEADLKTDPTLYQEINEVKEKLFS